MSFVTAAVNGLKDDGRFYTADMLVWFEFEHLPHQKLQLVSSHIAEVAVGMTQLLQDGPELSAGLRKLLEAKDCLVRQALKQIREEEERNALRNKEVQEEASKD